MTRRRKIILASLAVIVLIIAASAGSSSNKSTSTGPTSSPALVTNGTPAGKPKPHGQTQTFRGTGSENIGTINVPAQSTLRWTCRTCGGQNFQMFNDPADGQLINVNALGPTSGKTVVDVGTYHKVEVNTGGQEWEIRIVPGT